jgi:NAD(P)-dependent dehydrogenase (short-subunit alcohol dehydrogenase family)
VEEISDQEARRVYETDVFGLLKVTRAVLPHMRRRRSGHVINFSSVGGLSGSGRAIYCSTKFAVEGITEALAKGLAPLGILATAGASSLRQRHAEHYREKTESFEKEIAEWHDVFTGTGHDDVAH